jgi:MtN3 and saliva related transmembrane protein
MDYDLKRIQFVSYKHTFVKNLIETSVTHAITRQAYPQIYKTWSTKSAEDLSWLFLIINISGLSCMSVYSIVTRDYPILIPVVFSICNTAALLTMKWFYTRERYSGAHAASSQQQITEQTTRRNALNSADPSTVCISVYPRSPRVQLAAAKV